MTRTLTIEALAQARGLDPEFVRGCDVRQDPAGVAFSWPTTAGEGAPPALHIRRRLDPDGDGPRWIWRNHDRGTLLPFGAGRLDAMRQGNPGAVVVVESESDAIALWSAGQPALAVGGTSGWQARWWPLVAGFALIAVWIEDKASVGLLRSVFDSRPDAAPQVGTCHTLDVRMKDAGRLLERWPTEGGRRLLREAVQRAVPVERAGEVRQLLDLLGGAWVDGGSGEQVWRGRCGFHAGTAAEERPALRAMPDRAGGWQARCDDEGCPATGPLALLAALFGRLLPEFAAPAAAARSEVAVPAKAVPASGGGGREPLSGTATGAAALLAGFKSAADLMASGPEEVDWLCDGFLAPGTLTILGGREKAGKSTLVFGMVRALMTGRPFLGQPCRPCGVVYLTEEPAMSVKEKLLVFGLSGETDRLHLLCRDGVGQRPSMADTVGAAVLMAQQSGAGLLVVDTLSFWAGIRDEAENSSGAMQEALWPLLEATGRGLAVLLLHHQSKRSNELRGSTAIGASADIIVTLQRANSGRRRRRIEAVGRYQATPSCLIVELHGGDYQVVGTGEEEEDGGEEEKREEAGRSPAIMEERVTSLLRQRGETTQFEATAILEQRRQEVREALERLTARGSLVRRGTGKRGDPLRYRLPEPGEARPLRLLEG